MIIQGNFSDFFGTTMLPMLRAMLWNRYKQYQKQFPMVFQVLSSDREIEQYSGITGLGLFRSINDGEAVTYDTPQQEFRKTFTHSRFGLGFKISVDTIEDDRHQLIAKQTRELARSAFESQEIAAASIFNNGFTAGTYAGPDGVALFSASHPLVKQGGTQSNLLSVAADLDVTSLELALIDFETQKDSSGKLVHVPASKVIVAPQNRFNVYEICKSTMRSDTANNTTNALKFATDGVPEPFVWRFLTDPDAWFVCGPPGETGLVWFWRKKPYTKGETDFDTETGKYAMRYRSSVGFFSFYGVYGTPGA